MGHRKLQPMWLTECAFVDDITLCAAKEKDLQQNFEIWKEQLMKRGMKIHIDKIKAMVIGNDRKSINIEINGEKVE